MQGFDASVFARDLTWMRPELLLTLVGLAVVVGTAAFWVLAVGPAIAWRLRHGVWMG